MEMNEFIIAGGFLIAGVVFFVVATGYMGNQAKQADISSNQKDAERIASLIEGVSNKPFDYSVAMNLSLCDISVSNGVMTLTESGRNSSAFVSKSIKDADLKEVASICVFKKGDEVTVAETCPSE